MLVTHAPANQASFFVSFLIPNELSAARSDDDLSAHIVRRIPEPEGSNDR
jgi:hypothetical protein